MPKVIITMPAYRAETTLSKTIADIPAGVADELILVDDASPDDTVRVATELGIRVFVHPQNRGYGGNQKTCYTEALREDADIVVLLHPDYQYDPKAVPLLIAPILAGDADMTFGSRFAGLGDPLRGGMPFYRYWGNRITTTLENLMLGSRFTDMHSGLRAYSRHCLMSLPFHGYSDDFIFDTEFLVDAVTSGLRVVEVPIPTRYTKESSSISIVRSLRYVIGSIIHCARETALHGRRGKRNPATWHAGRRARKIGIGPQVEGPCALCGEHARHLVIPATAAGPLDAGEFSCTTDALGRHDDIVQCSRCGMVSSRPTLAPDEIIEQYEQVVDDEYLSEEGERRKLFHCIVDNIERYIAPGRRLLEFGANVGLFLSVAKERGWDVRGVEPSRWAVEQGVARFDVALEQGTIEGHATVPKSADVVVMLDVLEHLADPLEALRIIRPALHDEGLLVLSTVNLNSIHSRARGEGWPWFIRSHLHYFSPETLTDMLRASGYRVIDWSTLPRSFHLSYVAQRARAQSAALSNALRMASSVADVAVPLGWLGDIAIVVARPDV